VNFNLSSKDSSAVIGKYYLKRRDEMGFTQIIIIVYGGILLAGGYFGSKAGSKVSLVMGVVSGLLAWLGACLVGMNPKCGYSFLTALSGFLSVVFLVRLLKTKKIMPAGMLLIINGVVLALTILRWMSS
jgi:uncharacterized membrane protein (UPF0136 family)